MFTPPTPPSTLPPAPQKNFIKILLTALISAIILMGFGFQIITFDIFAKYETCIYIGIVASPLGIFIFYRAWPWLQKSLLPAGKLNALAPFAILYTLFAIITVLSLNIYTDDSLPEVKRYTVVKKHIQTNKNSKTYFADIDRPDYVRLPYFLSDTEAIRITKNEYDLIDLGITRIELSYHLGSLGFPWYESYSFNTPPVIKSAPIIKTFYDEKADIKSACAWKLQFDLDKEIEKLTPETYVRDFWQSGEPRSVETMINGQRHGVGHYTFANGKTYADIPWKHGQKHGVFTIFRNDGTREQTLSYKDGKIYGIEEWFDKDGNLSKSSLYLADEKPHDVNLCSPQF